jgi:ribosome maturation factor RimP
MWQKENYNTHMNTIAHFDTISQLLQSLLTDDIFLVEIKVKPTNNYKIYLDADSGLGIEKCIKINRALYKHMEEMALYPEGDFSLEVSSPGIDEPLKMFRQYKKNVGRNVEITFNDASKKEGELLEVNENELVIKYTEGKGKKLVEHQPTIPFSEIKQTKVLIKF